MPNQYQTMKKRHQQEFDAFPVKFVFSQEQFVRMMAEWGLNQSDTQCLISIGCNGYIMRTDREAFIDMCERHKKERREAMASDQDGSGYLYDMFLYELNNHEFGYTMDTDDTLNALELTIEQINASPAMRRAWEAAKKSCLS